LIELSLQQERVPKPNEEEEDFTEEELDIVEKAFQQQQQEPSCSCNFKEDDLLLIEEMLRRETWICYDDPAGHDGKRKSEHLVISHHQEILTSPISNDDDGDKNQMVNEEDAGREIKPAEEERSMSEKVRIFFSSRGYHLSS
jgi:hypothetical protein